MRLQLLSDLHLETEPFEPEPAPGAECLVLAGDIDASWAALERFAGWPVPVLMVAGNHEFDGRDLDQALVELRERTAAASKGRPWRVLRCTRTKYSPARIAFSRIAGPNRSKSHQRVVPSTRTTRPSSPVSNSIGRCASSLRNSFARL